MISVRTEEERKEKIIKYTQHQLEELERRISECDYIEDIDGNLVYIPDSYPDERRECESAKMKWEVLLSLLTYEPPFMVLD